MSSISESNKSVSLNDNSSIKSIADNASTGATSQELSPIKKIASNASNKSASTNDIFAITSTEGKNLNSAAFAADNASIKSVTENASAIALAQELAPVKTADSTVSKKSVNSTKAVEVTQSKDEDLSVSTSAIDSSSIKSGIETVSSNVSQKSVDEASEVKPGKVKTAVATVQAKKDKVVAGIKAGVATALTYLSKAKVSFANLLPSSGKIKQLFAKIKPSFSGIKSVFAQVKPGINNAYASVSNKTGSFAKSTQAAANKGLSSVAQLVQAVYAKVFNK